MMVSLRSRHLQPTKSLNSLSYSNSNLKHNNNNNHPHSSTASASSSASASQHRINFTPSRPLTFHDKDPSPSLSSLPTSSTTQQRPASEFDMEDYFDSYMEDDDGDESECQTDDSPSLTNLSIDTDSQIPTLPPLPPPIPSAPPPLPSVNKKKVVKNVKANKSTPELPKPTIKKKQQQQLPSNTKTKSKSASSSPLPSLTMKKSNYSKLKRKDVKDRDPKLAHSAAQKVYLKKTPSPQTTTTTTKKPAPKNTRTPQKPQQKKTPSSPPPPAAAAKKPSSPSTDSLEDDIIDTLAGVDKAAAKQIFQEIVVKGDEVHWEDIAGLDTAKNSLKEAVVYPFLRPDLFHGLREPISGMLLFGPPGTGKTMLARAVATESKSTFFSISASSLTSKYLGESEKLVRALFAVAKKLSPSIVFIDEIDSILGSRNNESENESSRRIKNEFLIQWSSLTAAAAASSTDGNDANKVLVLAATNLPWCIDDAARRRFVRRQYIPLPEASTRIVQFKRLLSRQKNDLTEADFIELIDLTQGFSGSDITALAKDAAMGPLRELGDKLLDASRDNIRAININDFKNSLKYIRPSVSEEGLIEYEDWAEKFGSSGV